MNTYHTIRNVPQAAISPETASQAVALGVECDDAQPDRAHLYLNDEYVGTFLRSELARTIDAIILSK